MRFKQRMLSIMIVLAMVASLLPGLGAVAANDAYTALDDPPVPVTIAQADVKALNKSADGTTRALIEFDLSTASGFAEGDLGKIKPAGFIKDTYEGTTPGSTWILENRPDDTGRPAKLSAWAVGEFEDADVCCVGSSTVLYSCPGKLVTVKGITLGGTEKGKYTLEETTMTVRAHITEREIATENNIYGFAPTNIRQDFMMGIDLSSEPSLRASTASPHSTNNFIFRNEDGEAEDIYKIYADHGVNYVRIRVWNDPYYHGESIRPPTSGSLGVADQYQRFHPLYGDGHGPGSYGGGNCNIDRAVEAGLRATQYGMKLLVNFHYSDCWGDPGRQYAPKDWINMNITEKCQALYDYTYECLEKLVTVGVDVGMVQVGNETQARMAGETLAANYYQLVKNGCAAIDDINEKYGVNIKKAVHFANPSNDAAGIRTWVNGIEDLGAGLDVVLLSWYPEYSSHGTLANLLVLMNSLVAAHPGLEVACGENDNRMQGATFSNQANLFPDYTPTPQGQAKEMYDIISQVSRVDGGMGVGVFYWEPAWATPIDANSRRYYGTGWASRYSSYYDGNNNSASSDGGIGSSQNNKNTFTTTTVDGGMRTPLPSMRVWSLVYGSSGRVPADAAIPPIAGIAAPEVYNTDAGATLDYAVTLSNVAGTNLIDITAVFDKDSLEYADSKIEIPESLGASFISAPAFDAETGVYKATIALLKQGALFSAAADEPEPVLTVSFKAIGIPAYNSKIIGALDVVKVLEVLDFDSVTAIAYNDPGFAESTVTNRLRFDINKDSKIDFADVSQIIFHYYLAREGDDNWDEAALYDTNDDGIIDLGDILYICAYFTD